MIVVDVAAVTTFPYGIHLLKIFSRFGKKEAKSGESVLCGVCLFPQESVRKSAMNETSIQPLTVHSMQSPQCWRQFNE